MVDVVQEAEYGPVARLLCEGGDHPGVGVGFEELGDVDYECGAVSSDFSSIWGKAVSKGYSLGTGRVIESVKGERDERTALRPSIPGSTSSICHFLVAHVRTPPSLFRQ